MTIEFLAQTVPFPQNDTNAWIWVAGAMLVGIGGMALGLRSLASRYDSLRDRAQERAEKQVDEALPSLKANSDAINAMVAGQADFKGFLGEIIAMMQRVATAVAALPEDHRKMLERLDSLDKSLSDVKRSVDDLKYDRQYPDDERAQRRGSRSGT